MSDERFRRKASLISIIVGSLLMVAKFWAFDLTGSEAVFSDALESIVNVVAALAALAVIVIASRPADRDHPYGHGKAEFFSAAFEGGLIAFAALMIIFQSIRGLIHGVELESLDVGGAVVLFAGVANAILGVYLIRQGKKYQSVTLEASGKHVLTDFWTSLGVVLALGMVWLTGYTWLDPLVALIVGVNLAISGIKIVRKSAGALMDEEDAQLIDTIRRLFVTHAFPGIIQIHHTRVMRSGRYHHIDSHVVVPEFWDVHRAHEETTRFENAVIGDYDFDGEVHFHVDPCRRAYCKACDIEDCPLRKEIFEKRIGFTVEELVAPDEPDEFTKNS